MLRRLFFDVVLPTCDWPTSMSSELFTAHMTASEGDKLCTLEAEAAVSETAFGVRDIRVAEALPFSESLAYINLTTLEGEKLCVEISAAGFRPVGVFYDDVVGPVPPPHQEGDEEPEPGMENYETIYALLSARSSGFRHQFSERLAQRLAQLQDQQLLEGDYEEEEEGGGK
ncbi:GSK3-beta interaction protein [Echinococcus granulosus]|nr:GSK3-beta interaction protein [Echinococcus granulosus]